MVGVCQRLKLSGCLAIRVIEKDGEFQSSGLLEVDVSGPPQLDSCPEPLHLGDPGPHTLAGTVLVTRAGHIGPACEGGDEGDVNRLLPLSGQ